MAGGIPSFSFVCHLYKDTGFGAMAAYFLPAEEKARNIIEN